MTDSSRPVRVLVALHSFEPGGVERDILRFVPAWRAHGVDARIALGRREGRLQEEAPDVPYFQMQKGRWSTARFETLWMIWKLPGIIREFKPEVLFLASNTLAAVAIGLRIRMGRECPPMVLRVSNDLVRRDLSGYDLMLHQLGLRLHAKSYAAVVAMADPVRDEIIEQMKVDPGEVVVINNASMTMADVEHFAATRDRTKRGPAGRQFLSVGRLVPQKNFTLFLEAFARIARPEDRLTIVGEGVLRPVLEQRAVELGIAGQLDLPGHHIGVAPWFAVADAFILSSDFEGVPAVLVEALATGLPIVATECSVAIPAMLKGVGRTVPIRDVEALASAMDAICTDNIDVAAMQARAVQFTTEATVDQWIALFSKVAQTTPVPEPIRVLTCLHSLQPGGVERDVLRFTKAWREHGVDARIAIGRYEGQLDKEAPDLPYFVLRTDRRFETLAMIAKLPRIIRQFKPHVLLVASNNHAIFALAMRLLFGRRCPPIVLRVSMDLARKDMSPRAQAIDRWALQIYSRIYRRVVAMAPPVEAQIVAEMGISPDRVVTIMNGSMTADEAGHLAKERDTTGRERPGRHFLGVGRLAPQKNFALLVQAFARMAKPDDRLTIVGEGPERPALKRQLKELGIASQVDLPGYDLQVSRRFAVADAFILSSDFEGLGNVVVEALAAGVPIVATDCCVSMAMLVSGAGRLVPIQNVEALAAAMDAICGDNVDIDAMRARAAQFTMEATVGQWVDLFAKTGQGAHL